MNNKLVFDNSYTCYIKIYCNVFNFSTTVLIRAPRIDRYIYLIMTFEEDSKINVEFSKVLQRCFNSNINF